MTKRFWLTLLLGLVALGGISWCYLALGLPDDVDMAQVIVTELRMPRLLCALGVGGLLSMAGVVMQALFRNPLVEPYTMGLSGGAVVGVALTFATGLVALLGALAMPIGAMVGGMVSVAMVLSIRRLVHSDGGAMLMCGIMVSFVSSAVTTILLSLSGREEMAQILAWTIGSFVGTGWGLSVAVAVAAGVVCLASPLVGNVLNVLSLGDDEARSLGVPVRWLEGTLFVGSALLAGLAVSASGLVAFVGMAVPHFIRSAVGADNRSVLPLSGLVGAAFVAGCDLVAKSIVAPLELPVGAITSAVGGVAFIYVLIGWRRNRLN